MPTRNYYSLSERRRDFHARQEAKKDIADLWAAKPDEDEAYRKLREYLAAPRKPVVGSLRGQVESRHRAGGAA